MRFFKPITRLVALALLLAFQTSLRAQFTLEQLPSFTSGVVFRGNELWQATDGGIFRRDLNTGEVLEKLNPLPDVQLGYQALSMDAAGNIWTVAGDNVLRFDGTNWQVWNSANTPVLPTSGRFANVFCALDGKVWMSTYLSNLPQTYVWDGSAWAEETSLRAVASQYLNTPQGDLLAVGFDSLLLLKNGTWTSLPLPDNGSYKYLDCPIFDAQGLLWLRSKWNQIYRYDDLAVPPTLVTTCPDELNDMVFDNAGRLLVASEKSGLGRWDGNSWQFLPSLAGTPKTPSMWSLTKEPSGRIWIAQSCLSYYAQALTLWDNDVPVKNFYAGIMEAITMGRDGAGNLWLAGYGPVLVRQNQSDGSLDYFELFDYGDENFLLYNAQLVPGIGDDIWLKTDGGRILHFDGAAWSELTSPNLLVNPQDLAVTTDGKVYFAGYLPGGTAGVAVFNPADGTWSELDFSVVGLTNGSPFDLEADDAGNLWIGRTRDLVRLNPSGTLEKFTPPANIIGLGGHLPRIKVGSNGDVYLVGLSTPTASPFWKFEPATAQWDTLPYPFEKPMDVFWSLKQFDWHTDAQGRLWAALTELGDHLGNGEIWLWEDGFWSTLPKPLPSNFRGFGSDGKGNAYFAFQDRLGKFKNSGRVQGTVRRDKDENCAVSPPDVPFDGAFVSATDVNGQQYLGQTRPDGQYRMLVGEGAARMNVVPPSFWWKSCTPDGVPVVVPPDSAAQADLLLETVADCPFLKVDIVTPFLRRCFPNDYAVKVCNTGTIAAAAAFVDIELPAELSLISATLPHQTAAPQVFRFDLGDVKVGDCRAFSLKVLVSCDSTELDQTLCVTAKAWPHSLCAWQGATVLADAQCAGDSVLFSLKNVGQSAMSHPQKWWLFEENLMVGHGTFSLAPGEDRVFAVPENGHDWGLWARQENGHPFSPIRPSLTVEGCRDGKVLFSASGGGAANSRGTVFEDIFCETVIGAFDPNDKAASPTGVGEMHHILPGTELNYTIRFQNTGTDTAFTVVVRDTLDARFDLRTLELGASSHPFRLETNGRALAFVFENILLPDSNINEAASHGFFSYRIRPLPDAPLGVLLTNRAAIYFDFNEPIVTNTVWHLLSEELPQVSSVPTPTEIAPKLVVFPNPSDGHFWVKTPPVPGSLAVFDAQGRLLQVIEKQDDVPVSVECEQCPSGLYWLRFLPKKAGTKPVGGRVQLMRN